MEMGEIQPFPPNQMFAIPSKQVSNAVSFEEEMDARLKNNLETSSILQQTNRHFSDYEELVTKLKALLDDRENILIQNKMEISSLSKVLLFVGLHSFYCIFCAF
jgi:hypothetical protein